jgi:hypothetical protein
MAKKFTFYFAYPILMSNNTKGTFQFLQKNLATILFYFIFSEEIIQYSRTSTPQVQTP